MNFHIKHLLHVTLCYLIVISVVYRSVLESAPPATIEQARAHYGTLLTIFITIFQYIVLLYLPQTLFNLIGLTIFDAFPGKVKIKNRCNLPLKSDNLPHICFRAVTRGLYPDLVQNNVNRNYSICIEAGLNNFSIEVVTDKEIPLLNSDGRIRQIVVPKSYRTPTGALFKARALQYALEPEANILKPGDYIVHLDEETIITQNVVNGIINFAVDGQHSFGQGLITYGNMEIVNWITTLADSLRVADDMGKIRLQLSVFHKPLFGWKGSFVVSKFEAEKDVSFDHGPDGSVAEDCYFSMVAFKKGYSFDFIQGEMWEKSPFTIQDFIRQRKRWIQGIWLVVHSSKIPIFNKFFLAFALYAWTSLPLLALGSGISQIFPLPTSAYINAAGSFSFGVAFYMYLFGVLKTFDLKNTGIRMMCVYLVGAVLTLPLNVIIENLAVLWGLISSKHDFYIVEKDIERKEVLNV